MEEEKQPFVNIEDEEMDEHEIDEEPKSHSEKADLQ